MGAYFHVVNPVKRQFICHGMYQNNKRSGLLRGIHSQMLAFLLLDERRLGRKPPLAIVGSWAGDPVVFPSDEEDAVIVRGPGEELLRHGIETRTQVKPWRNLWSMALEEFEELTVPLLAVLAALDPEVARLARGILDNVQTVSPSGPSPDVWYQRKSALRSGLERFFGDGESWREVSDYVRSQFPAGERFLLVHPSSREYLDLSRLAPGVGIGGILDNWLGELARAPFLYHWNGPIYIAGERSAENPAGVVTATHEDPRRNLCVMALAEYTDSTRWALANMEDWSDIVNEAVTDTSLLVELGHAIDSEGCDKLSLELDRQLGDSWPQRWYAEVCRRRRTP